MCWQCSYTLLRLQWKVFVWLRSRKKSLPGYRSIILKVSFVFILSNNLNSNSTQRYWNVKFSLKLFDKIKTKEILWKLLTWTARILETLPWHCPFNTSGCKEILSEIDIEEHQRNCVNRKVNCVSLSCNEKVDAFLILFVIEDFIIFENWSMNI